MEICNLKSDRIVSTASMDERKFVAEIKTFITEGNKNFCALAGPKSVGKTTCLMQLANWLHGTTEVIYYDFKQHNDIENEVFLEEMEKCFSRDIVFLLDEITYLENADITLARIAQKADEACSGFKVVITGGQPQAIRTWMHRYFSQDALIVYCSCLGFDEWLKFQKKEASYASYVDYVTKSADLFKITDNREYLAGCISETIISAAKSCNVIKELEDVEEDD